MRELLTTFVNALLSRRPTRSAAPVRRTQPGADQPRNGYRHRDLDTRVGTLDVAVPKLRTGSLSRSGCSSAASGPSGR
jgi:putative transposase